MFSHYALIARQLLRQTTVPTGPLAGELTTPRQRALDHHHHLPTRGR